MNVLVKLADLLLVFVAFVRLLREMFQSCLLMREDFLNDAFVLLQTVGDYLLFVSNVSLCFDGFLDRGFPFRVVGNDFLQF